MNVVIKFVKTNRRSNRVFLGSFPTLTEFCDVSWSCTPVAGPTVVNCLCLVQSPLMRSPLRYSEVTSSDVHSCSFDGDISCHTVWCPLIGGNFVDSFLQICKFSLGQVYNVNCHCCALVKKQWAVIPVMTVFKMLSTWEEESSAHLASPFRPRSCMNSLNTSCKSASLYGRIQETGYAIDGQANLKATFLPN